MKRWRLSVWVLVIISWIVGAAEVTIVSTSQSKLWIGLVEVGQTKRKGVLGDVDGAYTNAIAKAHSRAAFRHRVTESLNHLGLKLIRIEDAEMLKERLEKYSIDPELMKVANEAELTGEVGFGTFHTFDNA